MVLLIFPVILVSLISFSYFCSLWVPYSAWFCFTLNLHWCWGFHTFFIILCKMLLESLCKLSGDRKRLLLPSPLYCVSRNLCTCCGATHSALKPEEIILLYWLQEHFLKEVSFQLSICRAGACIMQSFQEGLQWFAPVICASALGLLPGTEVKPSRLKGKGSVRWECREQRISFTEGRDGRAASTLCSSHSISLFLTFSKILNPHGAFVTPTLHL